MTPLDYLLYDLCDLRRQPERSAQLVPPPSVVLETQPGHVASSPQLAPAVTIVDNGPTTYVFTESQVVAIEEAAAPRGRGRPKGARNKPKRSSRPKTRAASKERR